ncbi:MAG TPA: TonB family protein [Steroidobacteraceae bacterium]|nr:TonB family protein [Steroidobacteraceae bacterium]
MPAAPAQSLAGLDRESAALEALKHSIAGDFVEVVALTRDDVLAGAMRDALGPTRHLWLARSVDMMSDFLLGGGVGVLLIDAAALGGNPAALIGQIKRQFPDLVVMAAGHRDSEAALAGLVSDGTVYRFIHMPLSPTRARLFADAAFRKYEEQKRNTPPAPPPGKARSHRALWIGAALAGAAAAAAAVWLAKGTDTGEPGLTASKPGAGDIHAPRESPPTPSAASASKDDAPTLESRIEALTAQLSKARATPPPAAAKPPDHQRDAGGEDPIPGLLALAADRIQGSHLVDPPGDNALYYIEEALRIDPHSSSAQDAEQGLALRLLTEAHAAIDRHDFARAAQWIESAQGIAAEDNVDAARRQLDTARHQADTEAEAAAKREQGGRMLARARQSLALGQYEAAGSWLDQAAAAGYGSDEIGAVRRDLDAAVAAKAFGATVVSASSLTLIKSVKPGYPSRAERDRVEGWVELDFTVTEQGAVKDIAVHAASSPRTFDQSAIDALSQWRYRPIVRDSKPVAQRARIRIRFTLSA